MSSGKTALTPNQVRERLRRQGIPLTRWAREHGFPIDSVYRVMGGQIKARFGRSHDIAVALGLKVPDEEPNTTNETRNTQARKAG